MSTRAMDLNELIRLAFTESYAWISDAPVRDQTINWITISIGEVSPGDVLLLPATEINPMVLKMAHKKAATAVLILGKEPQSELQLPSDIYVAQILDDIDLNQAQRALLTILINQRAPLHE